MSLSELLDRTFTLYRNNFWLFCGIIVLPETITLVFAIAVQLAFPIHFVPVPRSSPGNPLGPFAGMQSNLSAGLVVAAVRLVMYALALGAVTLALSEIYLGRPVTVRHLYRKLASKIPRLLGLNIVLLFIALVFLILVVLAISFLLSNLVAYAGDRNAVFFLVLGLVVGLAAGLVAFWFLVRFSISVPALLLEQRGVFDALRRSNFLTRGYRWRIFGATIVMLILVYAVEFMIGVPFAILTATSLMKGQLPLWILLGTNLSAALSYILAGSLPTIMLALIYYDVRIRKEAFDLEAMMAALGQPPSAPATQGAALPPPQAL
jgi:hypothetical protein